MANHEKGYICNTCLEAIEHDVEVYTVLIRFADDCGLCGKETQPQHLNMVNERTVEYYRIKRNELEAAALDRVANGPISPIQGAALETYVECPKTTDL